MSNIVFDSSAVLALLKMEKGHKMVSDNLDNALISSVNFTEVATVVFRRGFAQEEVLDSLTNSFPNIIDFDKEQSLIAASLDNITKEYGLSLGDRACLALAKHKNLPVITADKIWKEIDLGLDIRLIR